MTYPYMSESRYRQFLAERGHTHEEIETQVAWQKKNGRCPSEEAASQSSVDVWGRANEKLLAQRAELAGGNND